MPRAQMRRMVRWMVAIYGVLGALWSIELLRS